MNARMPPKWVYYAAGNVGAVTAPPLLALLYPGYGLPIWALVFIVSLIGVNLTLWYSLRLRARLALATDETAANQAPKMSTPMKLRLALIGTGLLLIALQALPSMPPNDRIVNVLVGLGSVGWGTLLIVLS